MKLPPVGWAFFGSAVVALIGYVLNRGLYIGSTMEVTQLSERFPVPYYKKYCRYLYLNGVDLAFANSDTDREKAENAFCSPLRISN
jgi:hypothetical protein